MKRLRVGVILGGRSTEHEISLTSALSVMRAMDPAKYEVVPFAITKQGLWLTPAESRAALGDLEDANPNSLEKVLTTMQPSSVCRGDLLNTLSKMEVVFPVLHGLYGEDGTVQGLLELAGVPYVGCGVAASAIGMDKALMKALFVQAGLPVNKYLVVTRREWQADSRRITSAVEQQTGYPCFVKPANGGSSIGISKVRSPRELADAMDHAAKFDRKVVVEEAINGREIECGVLGNDDPVASTLGEIIPANEFYDFEAKYHNESSKLIIPAQVPSEIEAEIKQLAVLAFKSIDGSGMARVDFFYASKNSRVYINEVNTIPGFTKISMYPKLWEADGIGFSELIDRLLNLAIELHQEKTGS